VRNNAEKELVQRAALDLPLLKNRWPDFKKAVEKLHTPVSEMLTAPLTLNKISPEIRESINQIAQEHSYNLLKTGTYQGRIIAHVEMIYFDAESVRATTCYWAPMVDTNLTATELHTKLAWQELTQTQLLTADGLIQGSITPTTYTNKRRALLFFSLHTEWQYHESIITVLLRSLQVATILTVSLISIWVFTLTHKLHLSALVILLALLGLVFYSSLMLKALSLRTVLTMLITLQFGPGANKAADFAGIGPLVGSCLGLLLALLYLPARPGCPDCGRTVNADYRFCPFCNFALKRNCSRCAASVDTHWNYCANCSEDI
jgi:hypothetical protein